MNGEKGVNHDRAHGRGKRGDGHPFFICYARLPGPYQQISENRCISFGRQVRFSFAWRAHKETETTADDRGLIWLALPAPTGYCGQSLVRIFMSFITCIRGTDGYPNKQMCVQPWHYQPHSWGVYATAQNTIANFLSLLLLAWFWKVRSMIIALLLYAKFAWKDQTWPPKTHFNIIRLPGQQRIRQSWNFGYPLVWSL